jgi:hypothetical protein
MDAVENVRFGQIVTLGEPNEGPLVAPLQKFGLVLERARSGRCPALLRSMASSPRTRRDGRNAITITPVVVLFKPNNLFWRRRRPDVRFHAEGMDKRWPSTRAAAPATRSSGTSAKAPLRPTWSASPPSINGAAMRATPVAREERAVAVFVAAPARPTRNAASYSGPERTPMADVVLRSKF